MAEEDVYSVNDMLCREFEGLLVAQESGVELDSSVVEWKE